MAKQPHPKPPESKAKQPAETNPRTPETGTELAGTRERGEAVERGYAGFGWKYGPGRGFFQVLRTISNNGVGVDAAALARAEKILEEMAAALTR